MNPTPLSEAVLLFETVPLVETYGWEYHVTESDAGGARFEFTDVDLV